MPGSTDKDDQHTHGGAHVPKQRATQSGAKRTINCHPIHANDKLKKRTLTNLYNGRPTWLALAHEWLDHAVLDAYDWPHDLGDEEMLGRLLALNLDRAATPDPGTLPYPAS